jgi:hypothetical protein
LGPPSETPAGAGRYAWKGTWINARNAPRREEVEVRGRSAPALEQGKAAYPQAGLVEGEREVRKEALRTLERALRDLIAAKQGEREGSRLGFPRRTRKGRCRDSFPLGTEVTRSSGTTVTLPGLGAPSAPTSPPRRWRAWSRRKGPRSSPPPCPGPPNVGSGRSPWRSRVRAQSVIGGQRGGWHRGGGHAPAGHPTKPASWGATGQPVAVGQGLPHVPWLATDGTHHPTGVGSPQAARVVTPGEEAVRSHPGQHDAGKDGNPFSGAGMGSDAAASSCSPRSSTSIRQA